MLRVLSDPQVMADLQRRFSAQLSKSAVTTVQRNISFRPQTRRRYVHWNPTLKIWWYLSSDNGERDEANRWWNAFGVDDPTVTDALQITCEINFPDNRGTRVDRRIGGVLLEGSGDYYIGHRGNVGGGKKGVGKNQFMRHFREDFVAVDDGGQDGQVLPIARLGDNQLHYDVANFVHMVGEFKSLDEGLIPTSGPPAHGPKFNPEFEGPRAPVYTKRELRAHVRHGRIVRLLREELGALGVLAQNDQQRDLCVYSRDSGISAQFEVKTSGNTGDIYTAIGQLQYHSADPTVSQRCRNYAVLPEGVETETVRRLSKLGIEVIEFVETDDQIRFPDLRSKMSTFC